MMDTQYFQYHLTEIIQTIIFSTIYGPFDISWKDVFLLGVLFEMKIFCSD